MTLPSIPPCSNWDEFRAEMCRLAAQLGENPESVAAALDRGGALVNLLTKVSGVERPQKARGRPKDTARDDWLIWYEDHLRRNHGLKGKGLIERLSREVDNKGSIIALERSNTPEATRKAHQRARKAKMRNPVDS